MEEKEPGYHWDAKNRVQKLAKTKQCLDVVNVRGPAMLVPTAVSDALAASWALTNGAYAKIGDRGHATHVDRIACNAAFANMNALFDNFKNRYCKIPPCTEADIADMGLIENSTNRKAKGKPVSSCYCTVDNTAPGQIRVSVFLKEGSLVDPPGTLKGMVIRFLARNSGDPCQNDPQLLSDVVFCGGMHKNLDLGVLNIGKVVDISVAFKNGSEETGPWSPVISIVLS
ncbi:hypothetical protein AGMMS49942_24260 [Spirochaetia bacterium]|nr:hypothetical protein AGMMS49942_24260 [Spirochaetia bacterium]